MHPLDLQSKLQLLVADFLGADDEVEDHNVRVAIEEVAKCMGHIMWNAVEATAPDLPRGHLATREDLEKEILKVIIDNIRGAYQSNVDGEAIPIRGPEDLEAAKAMGKRNLQ